MSQYTGGYNYNKINIDTFLENLGQILDKDLSKFEHFLILGDFNSEMHEPRMSNFCETYNLKHIIKEPTYYKKHPESKFNRSHLDK